MTLAQARDIIKRRIVNPLDTLAPIPAEDFNALCVMVEYLDRQSDLANDIFRIQAGIGIQ